MKSRLILAAIAALMVAAPSHALSPDDIKRCNAMAASFEAKKAEIQTAKAALDEKAAATELAGERWEAAEQMKLMSPQAAQEAETSKADWEALKKEVMRDQYALKSQVQMLNKDVAAFNASCATE